MRFLSIRVCVREFFCLLHHKFALWLSLCFVLRSVFFYHSTILLLALSSHGFYCLRLLQFTRVLSAYERSIWDAKETRTRMNGVCTRFVHERVCVFVSKWTKSKRSHLEMKNTNNNAPRFECVISKIADIKTESDGNGWQFLQHFIMNYRLLNSHSFIHFGSQFFSI